MVEPQPSKLMTWVQSPSPAPVWMTRPCFDMRQLSMNARSHCIDDSAHIAQSVEHFLGKEEVTGSNPVMSSSCEL